MGWQELIVLVCVLAAALYLIRRYLSFLLPQKLRAKNDSCAAACDGCAKAETPQHEEDTL